MTIKVEIAIVHANVSFQVTELNLDNCRATQIEGLSDEYTSLELLSMINVGLTR